MSIVGSHKDSELDRHFRFLSRSVFISSQKANGVTVRLQSSQLWNQLSKS